MGPSKGFIDTDIFWMLGSAGAVDLQVGHCPGFLDGHGQFIESDRMPVFGIGIGYIVERITAVGEFPIQLRK
jgi:hypothetical protein